MNGTKAAAPEIHVEAVCLVSRGSCRRFQVRPTESVMPISGRRARTLLKGGFELLSCRVEKFYHFTQQDTAAIWLKQCSMEFLANQILKLPTTT